MVWPLDQLLVLVSRQSESEGKTLEGGFLVDYLCQVGKSYLVLRKCPIFMSPNILWGLALSTIAHKKALFSFKHDMKVFDN